MTFRPILLAVALTIPLAGNVFACGGPGTTFTGAVCLTTATYCPEGYALANGSTTNNPSYQSIAGTNTLPNLQAQAPAGTRYCVNVSGTYPQRP